MAIACPQQYPYSSGGWYTIASFGAVIFTVLSIGVHELSHAFVAKLCGIKIVEAGITGIGAYVRPEVGIIEVAPTHEMIISLVGPLSNFALAAGAAFLVWIYGESLAENTVQYVSHVNIRLGKLNLLPIFILDGGKTTHGFVRLFVSDILAIWFMILVSVLTIVVLLARARRGESRQRLEESLEDL